MFDKEKKNNKNQPRLDGDSQAQGRSGGWEKKNYLYKTYR